MKRWHQRKSLFVLLMLAASLLLNSCLYRMPDDDDLAIVPLTNNPEVVNVRDDDLVPGMAY